MEKALFSVSCTTCRAKISVRKKEAIGQILECPKCGSMVMISPPEGWVEEEAASATSAIPLAPASKSIAAPPSSKSVNTASHAPPPVTAPTQKTAVAAPPVQAAVAIVAGAQAVDPLRGHRGARSNAASAAPPAAAAAASPPAPPAPPVPPAATVPMEGPQAVAVRLGFTPYTVPEVVAGETYLSALAQSFAGRTAVLVLSGLLGLAGVLGIWRLVVHRHEAASARAGNPQAAAPAETAPVEDASATSKASPELIDCRWLPEQTICVLDLRPSRMAQQSQNDAVDFLLRRWQPYADVQSLQLALGLPQDRIRRLTWALTDLNDASAGCVVFELEDGVNPASFVPKGGDVDLGGKLAGRRLRGAPWPHTVAAVDGHRIVAATEDVLRRLAAHPPAEGEGAPLASRPLDLLLKKLLPTGEVAVLVDLSAARSAASKSPADWLDVWPEGKASWRLLYETPLAMSFSVKTADDHRCELGLVCSSEPIARTLRLETEKLLAAAMRVLPGHIAAMQKAAPRGQAAARAAEYARLLDELLASLHTYGCETADGILRLRLKWSGQGLPSWIVTALENDTAWKADRLAAARWVDEANHRGLLSALLKYAKSKDPNRFPAGAANFARALGPETRLSWIAELLPFMGHNDWSLNFASNWNSPENQRVAQRPLLEVVNPALGPAERAGPGDYPVTHYVGAAGVGEDAASLPADDPRAGVFGDERQTRLQDLPRGGANTIAILGVQDRCGPWAQGGRSTVRPLTQRPYVNGKDGFGSGQADGMVVGMADGSARFLSDKIDPEILEKLVTVRGGEKVDMSALDPQQDAEALLVAPPPARNPHAGAAAVRPPAAAQEKPEAPLDRRLRARLDEPVQKLSLSKMRLIDAVQLVANVGALKVSFDPDAMEALGVSLGDPVSIESAGTTVGALLDQIAAARNMARIVDNGQLLFTSKAEFREQLQTIHYTVSDLTRGDPQAAAELAGLIQRFIVPQSWQAAHAPAGNLPAGGGAIEVSPEVLKITQTAQVHHQIVVFCEKLRVARGLPPRSHLDPRQFSLQSRISRAKPMLGRLTSVDVGTALPLADILEQLKPPGMEFLIDRPALAAAKTSENAATTLRADKLPLGLVLRQLLEPLGLAWRAVDANTLQITTQKALAARLEVEFYPLANRPAAQPPGAVVDQVRAGVRDAVWGDAGASGALHFDLPSQCLIVLQAQPVQAEVEAFLAQPAK